MYRIADFNQRVLSWPRYAPKARELGIASMVGFQLYAGDEIAAALDVYSTRPQAFTEDSEHVGVENTAKHPDSGSSTTDT